jgi:hypothetical protein
MTPSAERLVRPSARRTRSSSHASPLLAMRPRPLAALPRRRPERLRISTEKSPSPPKPRPSAASWKSSLPGRSSRTRPGLMSEALPVTDQLSCGDHATSPDTTAWPSNASTSAAVTVSRFVASLPAISTCIGSSPAGSSGPTARTSKGRTPLMAYSPDALRMATLSPMRGQRKSLHVPRSSSRGPPGTKPMVPAPSTWARDEPCVTSMRVAVITRFA